MVNVFVDCVGHPDLFYSMYTLFEHRLGWRLWTSSITPDWTEQGVLAQPLVDSSIISEENGFLTNHSVYGDYQYRSLSVKSFLDLEVDFLVSTAWSNELVFAQLMASNKPTTKHICHIANIHEVPKLCKNVLLSIKTPMPKEINWIRYHPEHPLCYSPNSLLPEQRVDNAFNRLRNYPDAIKQFYDLEKTMPDFSFHIGSIPQIDFVTKLQKSMFVYYVKPGGCCGYAGREALSCGKPLIIEKHYCRTHYTLAQDYLHDGVNCVDIDPSIRSLQEAAEILREWAQPAVYQSKVKDIVRLFAQDMDFAQEAIAIEQWFRSIL